MPIKCECGKCKTCYAREHYRKNKGTRRDQMNARRRELRDADREGFRERQRTYYHRSHRPQDKQKCSKYGITLEQLDALRARAGGACQMPGCGQRLSGRDEHVDHEHSTGEIRGLLCSNCNRSLGHWEKLEGRAQLYLKRDQGENESSR